MGDRRHAIIRGDDGKEIYVYVHWLGSELPDIVRGALIRADDKTLGGNTSRLDDAPYLTRVIIEQVIIASGLGSNLSVGISTGPMDSEYDDVVIDTEQQEVSIGDDTWSFTDFMKGNPPTIGNPCREAWKEAVSTGETELGFEEWKEEQS